MLKALTAFILNRTLANAPVASALVIHPFFTESLAAFITIPSTTSERLATPAGLLPLYVSKDVFANASTGPTKGRDFQSILKAIGRQGDLLSMLRDSLATHDRLFSFFANVANQRHCDRDTKAAIKTLSRDAASLSDHASYLSQKIVFLLDATLGLISIEQNAIIKIFSVAAVIFLPPTLVASVYGMNFEFMPELNWAYGYPYALGLMVFSAVVPYLFFKRRGWL